MGYVLVETKDIRGLSIIRESVDGKKRYGFEGIYLEADVKNVNGRIYQLEEVMIPAVEKYVREKVSTKRALGELGHTSTPQINLERVSHLVDSLVMDGPNGVGKSYLLDTPMGKIGMALLDGGAVIGVSTRAVGSADPNGVVAPGLDICAVDIVHDPSAPKAFVTAIVEGKEWICDGAGEWVEKAISNTKASVDKKFNNLTAYKAMNQFLADIRKGVLNG